CVKWALHSYTYNYW
nr:immunoglobulin heavy chain junction region [Macaca mulatta]MOV51093.1 immunoglobulin heavy chain junction region [Macaca mulatta]